MSLPQSSSLSPFLLSLPISLLLYVELSTRFRRIYLRTAPCLTPLSSFVTRTGEEPEESRLREEHRGATTPGRGRLGETK